MLILLCYHVNMDDNNIYFRFDSRTKHSKVWDLQKTEQLLGEEICNILPFIHELLGCDTTFLIYGIDKGNTLTAFLRNPELREITASIMTVPSKEDVARLCEAAIVLLYGGLPEDGLNLLRFRLFATKVM